MMKAYFKRKYLHELLQHEQPYYSNDPIEVGDINRANYFFYFIPGYGGSPGQVKWLLPVFYQSIPSAFYLRCCYHEIFSINKPMWLKYTLENITKKRDIIIQDITQLSHKSKHKIYIICSSLGMYDFLFAYHHFSKEIKQKIILLWVSCAPDDYTHVLPENNALIRFFCRVSGIIENGYLWHAVPNHNLLKWINIEAASTYSYINSGKKYKIIKRQRIWC